MVAVISFAETLSVEIINLQLSRIETCAYRGLL